MFFDGAYFVSCLAILLSAAFLCLYPVKADLVIPLPRAFGLAACGILAYCLALAMIDANLLIITAPLFMAPCFYLYKRLTRADWRKLLFVFFVVASYICFCLALSMTFEVPVKEAALSQGDGHSQYQSVEYMLSNVGVLLVGLYPVSALLRRRLWPSIRDLEATEWNSLWILPLVYTLTTMIICFIMEYSLVYSWQFRVSMLLLAVGAFTSYYLIVRMMQKIVRAVRAAERGRMVESQLALQREQYERIQSGIAEARKARHDLRQSLAALSGLARQGDLNRLNSYLSQMIVQLPTESEPAVCRNMVVNAVVRHHLAQARDAGIAVTTRMDIPEDTGDVSQMDLCVLIGNMLENALEACMRLRDGERYIRLIADVDGSFLTISMENGFDGIFRDKDGAILSRKRDGEIEGIGLSSIRAIAESYQGYARFVAGDKRFETSVVVRLYASDKR